MCDILTVSFLRSYLNLVKLFQKFAKFHFFVANFKMGKFFALLIYHSCFSQVFAFFLKNFASFLQNFETLLPALVFKNLPDFEVSLFGLVSLFQALCYARGGGKIHI